MIENNIILFLYLSLFLGVPLFFVLGQFCFYSGSNNSKTKEQKELDPSIKAILKREEEKVIYTKKYIGDFDKLENVELEPARLVGLCNSILMENTPLGNVIMLYSYNENEPDVSTFIYYSNLTLPYRYLETIARRYCITFRCRSIYINMNDELERTKKIIEEKIKRIDEYCKTHNVNSSVHKKMVEDMNKQMGLKEKTNRFKYGGNMSNFSLLKCPVPKIDTKISFRDFKKKINT